MAAPRRRGLWAAAAVLAVSFGIVAALIHLGSPAERRKLWLDEKRVGRLENLVHDLETHLEKTGELPTDLASFRRMPWANALAFDPVTFQPFDYEVLDSGRYRLCADFARPSPPPPRDRAPDFWHHLQGRHCYEVATAGKEAPTTLAH